MSTPKQTEDEDEEVDPYAPLQHEEEYKGKEMHLIPKVPPGPNPGTNYDACNARKTERVEVDAPDESYRTVFRGWCQAHAGSGTDHKGEGRCKWHGGATDDGGPPAHSQNRQKHALSADPHHYERNLSTAERGFIEDAQDSILGRVSKQKGEIDFLDRVLARRIAIELHIVSKASDYVENESGLIQIITGEHGSQEEKAALLDDIRKRDKDIIGMLKSVGVLDDPESQKASALDSWREFVEGEEEEIDNTEVVDVDPSES